MSEQRGARRRRWWRRAVGAWVVAVAAGGGFTLWLHDSVRPRQPYVWDSEDGATPRKVPRGTPRPLHDPRADENACVPSPSAEPAQGPDPAAVACAYVSTPR
ncbi:hypothetical protein ACFZCP_02785 [Streptomyces sp. NPDC007971]|uniref:hypothetical protein n=1 Tax=Streptomyces sp. NPDC007971 TaxID=3364799 RepID=UPI0036EDEEA7